MFRPTHSALLPLALLACKQTPPPLSEESCSGSAARLIDCAKRAMEPVTAYEIELDYRIQHNFPPGMHGAKPDAPSVVVLSRSQTVVRHRAPVDLEVRAEVTEEPLYEGIPARTRQAVIANQERMLGSVAMIPETDEVVPEERVTVDRKALAPKDRPYDAGLSIPGTGFVPGLELFGTVRYILEGYTPVGAPWVVEKDGHRVIELTFERDPEKFADELFARRHELVAQLVVAQGLVDAGSESDKAELEAMIRRGASGVRALRSAKLAFSATDFLLRGLELGPSAEHPSHLVWIKRWNTKPEFGPDTFTVTSSGTTDLTEPVRQSRASFETTFKENPAAVRAARQQLSEALKKAPAMRPITTP